MLTHPRLFYPHIPPKHALQHIIVLKYWHRANFLPFFLCRLVFSSYFCNRLQDDSSLSGRATVSPMASGRRLFLCLGKSFFLTGKIIFPNWENRYAQYMAAA